MTAYNSYCKTIQSRIKRRFKITVALANIRETYLAKVKVLAFPSNDELEAIAEHFNPETYQESTVESGLTVVEQIAIQKPETIEVTPDANPDVWELLQSPATEPEQEKPEQETAKTDSIVPATNHLPIPQQPANTLAGISQSEITAAIAQAIQQTGQQGNDEAIQILTSLANELSADIADTQEMVVTLVSTYLGKRQTILSSAIGTLNTLRSAQTESFQGGLNQDFFGQKQKNKHEFLNKVAAMFN